MTRPYSADLRERALARSDAGETDRSIGEALKIAPSCLSKWRKLRRETGALKPGKMNGHKVRTLSGEVAQWLHERIQAAPVYDPAVGSGASRARDQDGSPGGVDVPPQ